MILCCQKALCVPSVTTLPASSTSALAKNFGVLFLTRKYLIFSDLYLVIFSQYCFNPYLSINLEFLFEPRTQFLSGDLFTLHLLGAQLQALFPHLEDLLLL